MNVVIVTICVNIVYLSIFNINIIYFSLDLTTPILSATPSPTVNEDNAVILKCNNAGSGTIVYQWYKNGLQIPGTSMIHILNSIQRNDVGNYQCIALNDYQNVSSNALILEVNRKYNKYSIRLIV